MLKKRCLIRQDGTIKLRGNIALLAECFYVTHEASMINRSHESLLSQVDGEDVNRKRGKKRLELIKLVPIYMTT